MCQVIIVLATMFALAYGLGIRLPVAPNDRIVNGTNTSIEAVPYQLSLQRKKNHICGASIISAKCALTAAHCVVGTSPSDLSLRAGSSYHAEGGTIHNVSQSIVHPDYNSSTSNNDVAVLEICDLFLLGQPGVQAIALATTEPPARQVCTISGWGTTYYGAQGIPNQLQYATVPIANRKKCSSTYKHVNNITDLMICAGKVFTDSCQGDSGGPLVCGNVLCGVVSFGIECALANFPGVYANVALLREWIQSICNC